MKNPALLVSAILLLFFTTTTNAQLSWQWGRSGGSPFNGSGAVYYEDVIDMTTDPDGNVYVLGNVSGQAKIDGHYSLANNDRLILASWDCKGGFRWQKALGAAGFVLGRGLRADSLGGLYVAGLISSTNPLQYGYIDTDSALGNTTKSVFIVKYDTSGAYQWLRMPQADTVGVMAMAFTHIYDIDVSSGGDVYAFSHLLPGSYHDGAFPVTDTGFYLLHYNKDGVFVTGTPLEIKVSATPGYGADLTNVQYSHLKWDQAKRRYYISGYYSLDYGDLVFGPDSMKASSNMFWVPYVAAFNERGKSLWTRHGAPDHSGMISSRAITDEAGTVYIAGGAAPDNTWGDHTFTNPLDPLKGYIAPFVIAMDTNGNNIWVTTGATNSQAICNEMVLVNNTLAVTGSCIRLEWGGDSIAAASGSGGGSPMNDNFLGRFNAHTGKLTGLDPIRSSYGAQEFATAITADRTGNFYIGGYFLDDLIAGKDTLRKVGGDSDWFVAKFGSAICDCTLPEPAFATTVTGTAIAFKYTGTTPVDSVSWDFGDGISATGITATHTYTSGGTYTVCVTAYTACGNNVYCMTLTTGTVGIDGVPGWEHISIYPNPASSSVIVSGYVQQMGYRLYSMNGGMLQSGSLSGSATTIDIAAVPAGLYVLELQSSNGSQQHVKIVKSH